MKKTLTILLALVILISTAVVSVTFKKEPHHNFSWFIVGDNAVISGSEDYISSELIIPESIEGYSVIAIDDYAFRDNKQIEKVSIPKGVKYIGCDAFSGCSNLKSIDIPDSVEQIESEAFLGTAYYRNKDNWEDGVLYIGKNLIEADENVPKTYAVKDGTKSIGADAFADRKITKITFPDSILHIGEDALCNTKFSANDKNWKNDALYVGKHLVDVGYSIDNDNFVVKDGTLTIADGVFQYREFKTVTLPDSLKTIGSSAFYECEKLKSINMPDGLTYIDEWAFYGCKSLTSINIPNSVVSIGEFAFDHCVSLKKAVLPKNLTHISESLFYCCYNLKTAEIPNSVTYIGNNAFSECKKLSSVNIPDDVYYIGYGAFEECKKIKKLSLPDNNIEISEEAFGGTAFYNNPDNWEDGVLYIGKHLIQAEWQTSGNYVVKEGTLTIADTAFSYAKIKSIKLPDSLLRIGTRTFADCKKLNALNIPAKVRQIGYMCYYDETVGIKNISVDSNNEFYSSEDGVLYNKNKTVLINYPPKKENSSFTVPDSVIKISENAFTRCNSLKEVVIPNSVKHIGNGAFENCKNLKKIKLPNQITALSDDIFANCKSLESITIPSTVKRIESCAFYGCKNLEEIILPKKLKSIDIMAFEDCDSLKHIDIPDGVKRIKFYTFASCDNLETIDLPENLVSIVNNAFYRCDNIKTVRLKSEKQKNKYSKRFDKDVKLEVI